MSIFEKILQKFCIRLQLLTIFFHFSPLQDLIFQFQFFFVNNNQYEIIADFITYITLFISLKNSKPNLRYLIFSTKGHFEFRNMAHADLKQLWCLCDNTACNQHYLTLQRISLVYRLLEKFFGDLPNVGGCQEFFPCNICASF